MPAKRPRGRITGSSSLPVAIPSRNSRRLAISHLHSQMLGQGTHHVLQSLAHEHDFIARLGPAP